MNAILDGMSTIGQPCTTAETGMMNHSKHETKVSSPTIVLFSDNFVDEFFQKINSFHAQINAELYVCSCPVCLLQIKEKMSIPADTGTSKFKMKSINVSYFFNIFEWSRKFKIDVPLSFLSCFCLFLCCVI